MSKRAIFFLLLSGQVWAIDLGSPLGNVGADMGRTTQTLNQMDKSQDGSLSRNQGYHEEIEKAPPGHSYNDKEHRDYVQRRKAMKAQKN